MAYDPPNRNPSKPIKWIIIDSLIIAGIAFVASLPFDRIPNVYDLYVALRAFIYAFLIQLAVERGLKPIVYKNGSKTNGGNGKVNIARIQILRMVWGIGRFVHRSKKDYAGKNKVLVKSIIR